MMRMLDNRVSGLRALLLTLALVCGCYSVAQAQTAQLPQELYLDAMQSIAEGRQNDASEALRRMIGKEPQHAGAWLDLALMQCELGHTEEAERLFRVIEERFAPPPVIIEVISRRRALGCIGWKAPSQFSMSLGRGRDNNLNQGASNPTFAIGSGDYRVDLQLLPEYLPQRDQYTLLSLDYSRAISANGVVGFAQFQAQQNDTLSRYNTTSLIGGADVPWRWGSWNMRSTGSLALFGLDGQLYQVQSRLQTQMAQPISSRIQLGLAASITHAAYQTQREFDSGTWELRGQLAYRNNWALTQASLSYLSDHALGQRPGGDRQGWLARLNGRAQLGDKFFGELGWSRQRWQSETRYSPGVIDTTRIQQTQIWRSALTYQLAPAQSLILEWRAVRNTENISIFQYNGRQIKLSWQWQSDL